jgi:hypothetical protein
MAAWVSFQSAIQLSVGANLAIFALPNLSQPAIQTASRRWDALLSVVPASEPGHTEIRARMLEFQRLKRELERANSQIRRLSLWIAAPSAVLLVVASYLAERQLTPLESCIVAASFVLGAIPAVVLVGLNERASTTLRSLDDERMAFQAQAASGG